MNLVNKQLYKCTVNELDVIKEGYSESDLLKKSRKAAKT